MWKEKKTWLWRTSVSHFSHECTLNEEQWIHKAVMATLGTFPCQDGIASPGVKLTQTCHLEVFVGFSHLTENKGDIVVGD